MSNMSEFIVDQSLKVAARQASQSDLAYGLMRALRRVRMLIDEIGGPITIPMLDSCLRNRIIIRSLRSGFGRGGPEASLPLPIPGAHALMAEELLTNAAESCLLCKSENTEDGDIFLLAFLLLDRMFELLQGVPDAMALLEQLRESEEESLDTGAILPVAQASVH
jgi:hypothetical protein